MTLVCVPIMVEDVDAALDEATLARAKGADIVEYRIDPFFPGSEGDAEYEYRVAQLQRLLAESPLPVVLTCRSASEGGDYDGDDADRVALLEKLTAACDHPPAYLDFELSAYTRSANIRQKINLCVAHPKQTRDVPTRLILSIHDFEGRPADLDRRLLTAYDEPACAVVKVAYRARSLRDNLDLFELTSRAPKPTIALGMGEFGLMSRVLAPKFAGFLTFASLRDEAATAPGQPTIDDLLGMYRFRSITKATRLYGVIGWPVAHSMSPLIHNAGFAEAGHDGVYLPLPIAADVNDPEVSYTSFAATLESLIDASTLKLDGASVTIPYKEILARFADERHWPENEVGFDADVVGAWNTLAIDEEGSWSTANTDVGAILELVLEHLGGKRPRVTIVGAGGVAKAAIRPFVNAAWDVNVCNRNRQRAVELVAGIMRGRDQSWEGGAVVLDVDELAHTSSDLYINCTPVGMAGGPDPDGLSIPIPDMPNIGPDTVFFDTVYNPIETPMLKAARERGCRTIDGVEMFVRQAALQFTMWTGKPAPTELFDRLVRQKLTAD